MKIYSVMLDADYTAISYKDKSYYEYIVNGFRGEKMIENWPMIEVKHWFSGEKALNGEEADVLSFELIPTFTKKAVDIFKEELEANAEILPLKYDKFPCFVINVTTVLDCLDEEKSKLVIRAKRVFRIDKHVFKKGINYPPIFKISTGSKISIYVTDAFVKKFEENKLTGMIFKLVWDSSDES